jgi:hypothetical protein
MTNAPLVPPEHKPRSFRERLLVLLGGAGAGLVVGLIAWLVSGEASWFYAVPIGAIFGWWASDFQPNVLWWRRGS